MCQIRGVQPNLQMKSGFLLVEADTYKVTYPQNSGYSIDHKYETDIGYNYDIAILYQRIKSENLGMLRYSFLEVNIVIDGSLK